MTQSFGSRPVRYCAPRVLIAVSATTPSKRSVPTAAACWCGYPASPTATPPTRCGGSVFVVDSADLPPIDEADTYYDHQLEGLRVRTIDGREIGVVAEVLHTAGGELLAVNRERGQRVAGAVRRRDRHVGLAGGRCRRDRSARGAPGTGELRAQCDENRRRNDLPDLPGSAARVVAGQGNRIRSRPARRARPPSVDARRAPLGRRLALRRRSRDGDESAGMGRGARRDLLAGNASRCPDACGRTVHAVDRAAVGQRIASGVRMRPL